MSELLLPRLVRFLATCQLSDLTLEHERTREMFERASLAYEAERAELQQMLARSLEAIRGARRHAKPAPELALTEESEAAL